MTRFLWILSAFLLLGCQTEQPKEVEKPSAPSYEEQFLNDSEAVRLAEAQLVAYNNRDLEAFLIPYGDSVKVFNSLHDFGYQGKAPMRATYDTWFNQLDTIHCEVVNRIATGNTVIDHEKLVYRQKGQESMQRFEAIAIYKVADQKIREVHFVRPEWNQ